GGGVCGGARAFPPSRSASRCRNRNAGRTRSALHWSQQRSPFTGHASLPKPTIAPPQIEQACTGIIVRAPLCAPEQAQQRGGRIEFSNTPRGLLSPPQAKASAIRSWLAPDELANLVLVALLPQQPLASFSVGAMLGGGKHSKDRATDRVIG